MPLGSFFERMGEQAGVRFVLGPGVADISMEGRADDEPIDNMVKVIAGVKGLSCRKLADGSFRIDKAAPPSPR